jgi:hypothetical protein
MEDARTFVRVFRRPGNYLPPPDLSWYQRIVIAVMVLAGVQARDLTKRLRQR